MTAAEERGRGWGGRGEILADRRFEEVQARLDRIAAGQAAREAKYREELDAKLAEMRARPRTGIDPAPWVTLVVLVLVAASLWAAVGQSWAALGWLALTALAWCGGWAILYGVTKALDPEAP